LERVLFEPWPGLATDADLLRLVERDKRQCEMIAGTIVERPASPREAAIAMNVLVALVGYSHEHDSGVVAGPGGTLRMISGNVRIPDASFISNERLPKKLDPIPLLGPDLAVEVVRDGQTALEMELKLADYFESGARLAWIIHPATRSVVVYHGPTTVARVAEEGGELDGEQVLPGFRLLLEEVFRDPLAPYR
jgi:Uma2 family endonuclease